MIWGLGIDLTEIERIHRIRQKGMLLPARF